MTDNSPLFETISGYLNEAMLAALAKSYDDGRLLLVGTSDLDAQQPVIWNIGAIAKSGHPRALDTIRRILLASAAIPGAFPPTMFDAILTGSRIRKCMSTAALSRSIPLSRRADTATARTYGGRSVRRSGDRLCHPQRPARS